MGKLAIEVMSIVGALFSNGACRNNVLDENAAGNRDDCYRFYRLLRARFESSGWKLATADKVASKDRAFSLCIDMPSKRVDAPAYLIQFETPMLLPRNGHYDRLGEFRLFFTWDDAFLAKGGSKTVKLNFPNNLFVTDWPEFGNRRGFACMIAGNKTTPVADARELYTQRVRTIRWFEKNAPDDFALYGVGWNAPPRRRGFLGKVLAGLHRELAPVKLTFYFPSYRGPVRSKAEVYRNYRFAICYENVRDLPGYITEKVFDAFTAGCVPVYWGAPNVQDYIPAECFIDRRAFASHEELYAYLKGITEKRYREYQEAIRAFLESPLAYPFSAEAFAETVVTHIVADLKELGVVG